MPIMIALCIVPLALAACVQYLVCRFVKRMLPRLLPLLLSLAVTVAVALARYFGWSAGEGQGAPLETLLFIPGIPAAVVLLGLFIGWRHWKHRWGPRILNGG